MPTVFSVRASAGKGGFSVSLASGSPLIVKVGIPAQMVKGRANRALLSELENLLGCKVEILSGHTGRKKTLAADCSRDHLLAAIKGKSMQKK